MQFQLHQLRALEQLEHGVGNQDASAFRESLRRFTSELPCANIEQFSSFHSLTTVFEFFAAYLVFRSCRVAVLIPQSWIDFHLPWFGQSLIAEEIPSRELHIYGSSLVELTICYCELLSNLTSLPSPRFRLGKSDYPSRLLHRRNVELLAIAIVNLGYSNAGAEGFKNGWARMRQVCV